MAYGKHGHAGEVIVIPGVWQHLVDTEARHRGPDPRIYVSPGDIVTEVAGMRAPSALQAKLDAGEPVVVPGWRLPGGRALRRQHPELCGRAPVRVFSDDRCELTSDRIDATTAAPRPTEPAGRGPSPTPPSALAKPKAATSTWGLDTDLGVCGGRRIQLNVAHPYPAKLSRP